MHQALIVFNITLKKPPDNPDKEGVENNIFLNTNLIVGADLPKPPEWGQYPPRGALSAKRSSS
jgi:hypothetical protein